MPPLEVPRAFWPFGAALATGGFALGLCLPNDAARRPSSIARAQERLVPPARRGPPVPRAWAPHGDVETETIGRCAAEGGGGRRER